MPSSSGRAGAARAVLAGVDGALVSVALGVMYALIAYAALGPAALAFSMYAAAVALLIGGLAAFAGRHERIALSGATASGTLVVAGMVRDLQSIPGAAGQLEPVLVAVVLVTLATGALQLVFARLGVGSALKFVPYPVLAGFTNTVALSLVVSMLPAALGHDFPGRLVDVARWWTGWRPAAVLVALAATAAGLAVGLRWPRAPSILVALIVGTAVHYAWAAGGHSAGLGPALPLDSAPLALPGVGRLRAATMLGPAYWSLLLEWALVLSALNSMFSLLTSARLAAGGAPVDGSLLLRRQGRANLASACLGGLPVAVLSPPTLALRAAPGHRQAVLAVYLVVLAVAFTVGRPALALLPMAAVAGAVFVAARGLLDPGTPWLMRQSLPGAGGRSQAVGPLAVGMLVVAVGLLQGLASALFVGALAAACLLALELRRGVVLAVRNGQSRRSRRVRPAAETARLAELGDKIRVVELGHWLYFGTIDSMEEAIERQVATALWIVLDLSQVAGIDLTAAHSLVQASRRLRARGVRLVVAGLAAGDQRRLNIDLLAPQGKASTTDTVDMIDDTDEALQQAEDSLVCDLSPGDELPLGLPLPGVSDTTAQALLERCETVTLQAGQALFRAGDAGDALYAVRSGRMALRVDRDGQRNARLLTFGPGVIFGEMAFLDGRRRSADAVADTPTQVLVLHRADFDALAQSRPDVHADALHGIALHLVGRMRETTALLTRF